MQYIKPQEDVCVKAMFVLNVALTPDLPENATIDLNFLLCGALILYSQ